MAVAFETVVVVAVVNKTEDAARNVGTAASYGEVVPLLRQVIQSEVPVRPELGPDNVDFMVGTQILRSRTSDWRACRRRKTTSP